MSSRLSLLKICCKRYTKCLKISLKVIYFRRRLLRVSLRMLASDNFANEIQAIISAVQ